MQRGETTEYYEYEPYHYMLTTAHIIYSEYSKKTIKKLTPKDVFYLNAKRSK